MLLSIHFRWQGWLKHKISMFHFIEFIGRWSFLDIYVIALLGALVQFGTLTTIEAQPAATYFTAVVIASMLAALAFDTRVLWDVSAAPNKKGGTP
jgi:paraquat-inducible protein A